MNDDRDLKDRLWVRLSVDVLEDDALNECSIVAQAVYFRGLAHAKRAARNGLVTRRAVLGGLFGTGVLAAEYYSTDLDVEVDAGIQELVEAELWAETDRPGTFQITGWLKHNEPVEDIVEREAERKARKAAGAHRTNHNKGLHDTTPHADCPDCNAEKPQAGAHDSAKRPDSGSGSDPEAERYEDRSPGASETESESKTEPQPQPERAHRKRLGPSGQPPSGWETVTAVAELFGIGPLDDGIAGAVEIARVRGWPDPAIVALAEYATLRATRSPRGLWAELIEVRTPPLSLTTADEIRAFLEDQPDEPEEPAA